MYLYLLTLALWNWCCDASLLMPSCDYTSEEIREFNDAVSFALREQNYTVTEGEFKIRNSTSFGANPGNPYVTYYPPGLIKKHTPIFTLSPNSAVLFIGCTPYSAAYFSWRSYAFTSEGKLVFASLGDSLNNLVINTTDDASFDAGVGGKLTAIATTADAVTLQQVQAAVLKAGVPSKALNLDAIPSSLLNMQKDRTLRFIMLHRASIWKDEDERNAYFNQNRKILFITPPPTTSINPIPLLPLRKPGTGTSEISMPKIASDLQLLREAIIKRFTSNGQHKNVPPGFNNGTLKSLGLDGFKCLREGLNCRGDNRDTHYLQYHDDQFASDEIYVIYGTNSVLTGKCTYSNFGLYSISKNPIVNRSKFTSTNLTVDNRKMSGSAASYGVSNDHLFAYILARNCEGYADFCLQVDTKQVPVKKMWAVAYRPYLEPSTKTGPLLSEIVAPMTLKFEKISKNKL